MSDTSHDLLDLLPEPHRTLAKQRRADAAREAQTPNSDIPRHLRIALASATRAFQSGDLSTLGTANEDLQPLLDAAIAWGRRQAAPAPALLAALEDQERACRVLADRDASLSAEEYEQRAADDAALLASPKAGEILGVLEREALYERHLRGRTLAQVERLRAANEELRLALAAEQGKPEGAPSEGWSFETMCLRDFWTKTYEDGSVATVQGDGSWMRGAFGSGSPAARGKADHQRAAMIAADNATSTPHHK